MYGKHLVKHKNIVFQYCLALASNKDRCPAPFIRLIPDKSWRYYDTAHVVYYPKQMTVEEFEREYDKICRTIYAPLRIAQRGLRSLARHPLRRMPAKMFGSFSTDYGYRRTFAWRHNALTSGV